MKRGQNRSSSQCNFFSKNRRGQNRNFSLCAFPKNRRGMKKGLSTIVITLIITLLALVAIGIVWVVIRNLLTSGSNEIGITQFTTKLDITNAYEQSGTIHVAVKRNVGEGTLIKIKFILAGGQNSEVITNNTNLQELGSANFVLSPLDISSTSVLTVSVAPVIRLSDGSERLLDITDTYYLSSGGTGGETGGCTPACSGLTPFCVTGTCAECSGSLGCTGTDICSSGVCVPAVSECTPACSGLTPFCVTGTCVECRDITDCVAGTVSCSNGICVPPGCVPETSEQTCGTWNCGTRVNNCGALISCGALGGECAAEMFCSNGACEPPILINEGTVTETWPGTSGMYFGSPDLPTITGTDYTGDYVSYTGAVECSVIALFRTPVPGYTNSHIGFNFETSIAVGNHYQIWQTLLECQASL